MVVVVVGAAAAAAVVVAAAAAASPTGSIDSSDIPSPSPFDGSDQRGL